MVATAHGLPRQSSHSVADPTPAELAGILLRLILSQPTPGPNPWIMSRIDRLTRALAASGVAPDQCRVLADWSVRFFSAGGWRRHGRAAIRQVMIDHAAAIATAAAKIANRKAR